MTDPVLHVLAGPNGAGKTTLYERVIGPSTHLLFVNADRIASQSWPGDELAHGHDASQLAAVARRDLIEARQSFVTETVFSHPSKIDLLVEAADAGYLVSLHVIMIPVDLAVIRVRERVAHGGHDVPEAKIRQRWHRLWTHVAIASTAADELIVFDNSVAARPYRIVARVRARHSITTPDWPVWTPPSLRALTD